MHPHHTQRSTLRRVCVSILSSLLVLSCAAQFTACKSPDWKDPEYIKTQLEAGSLKAFDELIKLPEDQQKALIPSLIKVYNSGKDQDRVFEILKGMRDPAAKEVYADVFKNNPDNRKRAAAAIVLSQIKAKDLIPDMVQVFRTLPNETVRRSILEAFAEMPDGQQVPLLIEILNTYSPDSQPIAYHSYACDILAALNQPTESIAQAVTYGAYLDNPKGQNVYKECATAVFSSGKLATDTLIKAYKGEFTKVEKMYERYPTYVDGGIQSKAIDMLALLRDPKAADPIIASFSAEAKPEAFLQGPKLAQWHANRIQLFVYSIGALGDLADARTVETAKPFIFLDEKAIEPYKDTIKRDKRFKHDIVKGGLDAIGRSGDRTNGMPVLAEAIQKADIKDLAPYSKDGSFVYQSRWEAAQNYARLADASGLETWDKIAKAEKVKKVQEEMKKYRPMLEVAAECKDQVACLERHISGGDAIKAEKAAWELAWQGKRGGPAEAALLKGIQSKHMQVKRTAVFALYRTGTKAAAPKVKEAIDALGKPSDQMAKDLVFKMKALYYYLQNMK